MPSSVYDKDQYSIDQLKYEFQQELQLRVADTIGLDLHADDAKEWLQEIQSLLTSTNLRVIHSS